jgi:hypothetical protein
MVLAALGLCRRSGLRPRSPQAERALRVLSGWNPSSAVAALLACRVYNVCVINWREVELEPEVDQWFETLDQAGQETAVFYVDLLAERGVLLDEPYTRQLRGKLRELRFHLDRESVRISYWIAPGRRIILLTVFRKRRMRETAEVKRAWRAMRRCIAEAHTVGGE